jgi:hypothetical protein
MTLTRNGKVKGLNYSLSPPKAEQLEEIKEEKTDE